MEDFPFATVESYKTLDRPLCMFVLAQNKSGGGRNAMYVTTLTIFTVSPGCAQANTCPQRSAQV